MADDVVRRRPVPNGSRRLGIALLWGVGLVVLTVGAIVLTNDTQQTGRGGTAAATEPDDTSTTAQRPPALAAPAARVDIDGDGRTDPAIVRDGVWWILGSETGELIEPQTISNAVPVPADYDGDGSTDLALVASNGLDLVWSLGNAGTATLGRPGDEPVPADYDGDGAAEVAVVREDRGELVWLIGAADAPPVAFGKAGDQPVPADYDGDGRTDIAVRRGRDWYVLRSTDGVDTVVGFGRPDDLVAPGDFDGDGLDDIAIVRAEGPDWQWWILDVGDGPPISVSFGRASPDRQVPIAGDFNGDGFTEPAVADLSEGVFYAASFVPGELQSFAWGSVGDVVVGALR